MQRTLLRLFCVTFLVVTLNLTTPTAKAENETATSPTQYPQSQGWNQDQMRDWYELSQGSRLVPLKWLDALKNTDGSPFFTRQMLESLGYIYISEAANALPAGFIIDSDNTQNYLGFNCSACHTAKLKSGTAEVLIHGGQTLADFQTFTTALIASVARVSENEPDFMLFADKVVGKDNAARARLKSDLTRWLAFRGRINETANASHWGRGRADAVGVILATTATVIADPEIPLDQQEPLPASNAPVSYPFVWNTNQQARLQHNGVVDNGVDFGVVKVAKIGALIRNWTEALGVFADVKLDANASGVMSSIRLDNLLKIEQALAGLQSPQWPKAFGALDAASQNRGQQLYKTNCSSCHGILEPKDITSQLPLIDQPAQPNATGPKGFVYLQPLFDQTTRPADFDAKINPSPQFIGTDPGMACNALLHNVPSGRFEGQRNITGFLPSLGDKNFADRSVTTDLLRVLIQRDILAHKTENLKIIAQNQWEASGAALQRFFVVNYNSVFGGQGNREDTLGPLREDLKYCADLVSRARAYAPDSPLPVYKARPLNGIWATAPYLHNGSVPTLYDLLLPQNLRPKTFGYFDGEMDVAKGGLKDASANPEAFIFQVFNPDGVVNKGNWNGGHEYGTSLSHSERMDLVEYVKGL